MGWDQNFKWEEPLYKTYSESNHPQMTRTPLYISINEGSLQISHLQRQQYVPVDLLKFEIKLEV